MSAYITPFLIIETALLVLFVVVFLYKSFKLSRFTIETLEFRKNYEKQLAADKEKEDFLAMLVHELRSPLAVMKGASDLMLKDAAKLSKEQIETLLAQIRTSSAGMLKIVNDILDVSKMDSGKFEVSRVFGDINKILSDECSYYAALAGEKQVKIETKFDDTLPSFNFDPDRIRQVMNNLLSNAIKFAPEGSVVTVGSQKNQNMAFISISDDGDGIPDELKHKLFHKFVQLDGRNHVKVGGTGLGLVVCKGIIETHGGKVWIEDNHPKGAKFVFSIPLS